MNDETWCAIPGYGGTYEASSAGRVRSVDRMVTYRNGRRCAHRGVVLRPRPDQDGYLRVALQCDRKTKLIGVHRLVCMAFHGPARDGAVLAAHRDGDRRNNAASNLHWATPSQRHYGRRKTHCPHGHAYTPANTYTNAHGHRRCRTCERRRVGEYAKAHRAQRNADNRRYWARKKAMRT